MGDQNCRKLYGVRKTLHGTTGVSPSKATWYRVVITSILKDSRSGEVQFMFGCGTKDLRQDSSIRKHRQQL